MSRIHTLIRQLKALSHEPHTVALLLEADLDFAPPTPVRSTRKEAEQ